MNRRFFFRRYRLPFLRPVRTAHGWWREREGLILRAEGEDGAVGWGEAAPIAAFGTETVDEAEQACAALGGAFTEDRLKEIPPNLICLRAALSEVARDLRARDGGPRPPKLPRPEVAGHPYLPVAALLPAGKAALAEVGPRAEAGFRVFKWKVAVGDARDELGLLDDLCAALPAGARLRLDANGGWDRRRAELWLDRCAGRPIEHVEQPVAPEAKGAEDTLRGLAADYPTPIALDESLGGDADVAHWLESGWPGIFVLKPSLVADPAETVARLARAKSAVVFSSALETAVGARAALRCAFAWPGETRALGFGVWPLFSDPRFDGPAAAPFLREEDVERIEPSALWNALI